MLKSRSTSLVGIALTIGAVLVAGAVVVGCSGSDTVASADPGPSAMGSLAAAQSALETTAPDAKLLVIQTATSVTPTSAPVWAYLFGDPATDTMYLVYTQDGTVMSAEEYGTAGLSEDEWSEVPELDSWKIDSDDAYEKGLAVSGATGDPAAYMMGLMTYKAADDTSTVEPFVWNVWFDPGTSGATTSLILVDAKSGDASVSE